MSLDVTLIDPTSTYEVDELYSANITHNLGGMAQEAGIYEALWRPYRLNEYFVDTDNYDDEYDFKVNTVVVAKYIIPIIEKGLKDLKDRPEYFEAFNSPNGWGMYEHFVPFVEKYLEALKQYPKALVETDV